MGGRYTPVIGRIERMNIVPRLLFLFQSLPIMVSSSQSQSYLNKFGKIKKARIEYKILLCTKEKVGLNLQNLKIDYWAAQLRAIIMWITKENDTLWVGMGQTPCVQMCLPFLNEKCRRELEPEMNGSGQR